MGGQIFWISERLVQIRIWSLLFLLGGGRDLSCLPTRILSNAWLTPHVKLQLLFPLPFFVFWGGGGHASIFWIYLSIFYNSLLELKSLPAPGWGHRFGMQCSDACSACLVLLGSWVGFSLPAACRFVLMELCVRHTRPNLSTWLPQKKTPKEELELATPPRIIRASKFTM